MDAGNVNGKFLLESCWQKAANCVCLAYFKAILLQKELHVRYQIKKIEDTLSITLPNGESMILSIKEIRLLNRKNDIGFRRYEDKKNQQLLQKIKNDIQLLFAIVVKNLCVKGNGRQKKRMTRIKAIRLLTKKGMPTTTFHQLLGIEKTSATIILKKKLYILKNKKAILLYTAEHITVASDGYYEENGNAIVLDGEIPSLLGNKATRWFALK